MAEHNANKGPGRQALLVLGMHRSGTSAISGVLAMLGAHAPRSLMEPTKDNPRGYWESVEVMKANEQILSSAGSRWNDWGPFNADWFDSPVAEQFRASLVALIEREYGTAPLILIKDPRISRFLPVWVDALRDCGVDPKVVIPIRHPLAVARSLEARDHFGRNRSLLLWLRHVLDAEASSRQLPRAFVPYESVLADWKGRARKIATELQIVWPKWSGDTDVKVSDFLSSALRHHIEGEDAIAGDSELAGWVRRTYEALLQASERPMEHASLDELDRIRREFNHGSELYAPVVREHQLRVEALYADMKVKLAESIEKCKVHEVMRAEAERKLSEGVSAIAEQRRETDVAKSALDAEEQSKVQQKMMDEQLALAATEHATGLAEQQARYETAMAELSQRLTVKEQESTQLNAKISSMADEAASARAEHQVALQSLQEQVESGEEAIERLSGELLQLKSRMEAQAMELNRALSAAEASARVRFRETAKLTELLFENEAAAAEQAGRAEKLAALLLETENRSKRHAAVLEYRNAFNRAMLSRRSDAWQQQAEIYAQALNQVGSSRAWSVLSRLHKIHMPPVREPNLDQSVDFQVELLRASELFDAKWYLERYPDAAHSAMEPERHYLLLGAPAGYSPGPGFDSVAYLVEYPDVREAGIDPLVHYLEHGQAESRTRTALVEATE